MDTEEGTNLPRFVSGRLDRMDSTHGMGRGQGQFLSSGLGNWVGEVARP